MENSAHYKNSYGAWAGFPKGHSPNLARCCEEVWSKERWSRASQCTRPRGHGPDGAYCKQHDPEVVKVRNTANAKRSNDKWNKQRYQIHGHTFFDALLKIAEGHNDARGLAQQVVQKFKDGEAR